MSEVARAANTGRIHPLTGDPYPVRQSGPRPEAFAIAAPVTRNRRAELSYDAARTGTDMDPHWSFADALDPDCSHNRTVRQKLTQRSRYEAGSNGYYAGIVRTHCNMVVGVGPTLRMMTKNRDFNQLVEREFFAWCQASQFRRKLWSMCYAKTADGEAFSILQTNPGINGNVQLDQMLIECEQCQTPFYDGNIGKIDGIIQDEFGNVIGYDILPHHPGGSFYGGVQQAIKVPASHVLHWFKLSRPGTHRGVPDLTSTLNVGGNARRFREATIAAAETAADIGAILSTGASGASADEPDPVAPFTSVQFAKNMLMMAPMGWTASQMKGEHPNAQYGEFNRTLISEQSRPLSMPYNAAACDSSTYSFASGKLDTLCYRAAIDVERCDCNDLVLDPLFREWFREWSLTASTADHNFLPLHQWDWPAHPVIDAVAESNSQDTNLKNGTQTLRQAYSEAGTDYEEALLVMAEDWFGEASEENIAKARQINLLRNVPDSAMPAVASLLGINLAPTSGAPANA